MEPFASPVHLPISPAPTPMRVLVGAHIVVVCVLLWFFPFGMPSAGLSVVVLCSLFAQLRDARRVALNWRAVLLGTNDVWSAVATDGVVHRAVLLPGTFVSCGLVIIRLKPGAGRPLQFVLTRGNTPADAFRRLRVRLSLPITGSPV